MGMKRAKILIVDDDRDHGQKIADILWNAGWPVLFVHYTPQKLMDGIYGTHCGIRAIFLDIDLEGAGIVGSGSHLYTPAESAVGSLLEEYNGPYALITWSTFDDRAPILFQHLKERLPSGKRPISLTQMKKEDFLGQPNEIKLLRETVMSILGEIKPLSCLTEWEGQIKNAAAHVVNSLAEVVSSKDTQENFEEALVFLLYQIACAEAGQKGIAAGDDIAPHLYPVLSELLSDRLCQLSPEPYRPQKPNGQLEAGIVEDWYHRINGMIHYDSTYEGQIRPGVLIQYPDQVVPGVTALCQEQQNKFIRKYFFYSSRRDGRLIRQIASENCELFLMDVTPSCDHAQQKVIWRRFITGCRVPAEHVNHLWIIDRRTDDRIPEKPIGDHIKVVPEMTNGKQSFRFAFNANLLVSIPEEWLRQNSLESKGRLREQMLAAVMDWMGHHISRTGYVSLPV